MDDLNLGLAGFIDSSPTAFHTSENICRILKANGFAELKSFDVSQNNAGGKFFAVKNGSAVVAVNCPEKPLAGFMLCAAHGDSPAFRLKPKCEFTAAGGYTMLSTEPYGSMNIASWADRPLSVAGRVVYRNKGLISSKIVNLEDTRLVIPSVAIHMNRSLNDGTKYNPAADAIPLYAQDSGVKITEKLSELCGAAAENILAHDLFLYCAEKSMIWGPESEFISAPRLDDLQCVYAALNAFIEAAPADSASVLCVFDNEEVGSGTKQGAGATFLSDVLEYAVKAFGGGICLADALKNSFMVSADNAHGVHPNHPEYADRTDRPVLNGGVVIKHNASQRYTTDAVSEAVFGEYCRRADVPVQHYTNRADIPGGSTLGHISLSHVSVDSVDIGLAQFAMHSAYETAGTADTAYLKQALKSFWAGSFQKTDEGVAI